MPELRQLRAFVAVAEERNFTRAAARLHLAQQAVSKTVAQLERELGVTLLERTTREVSLTAAGAALLADGRALLQAADTAFSRAVEVGHGLSGTVRLGFSPGLDLATREEILDALRADAPELTVAVLEIPLENIAQQLRDRCVDLVLAHGWRSEPAIDSLVVRVAPMLLCVHSGHRLADAEPPVPLSELDGDRLLVYSPPGTPLTDTLLAQLAAGGAIVTPVQSRVTGTHSMSELLALDAIALRTGGWPPTDEIVEHELEDPPKAPLLALWPSGTMPPPAARIVAALRVAGDDGSRLTTSPAGSSV